MLDRGGPPEGKILDELAMAALVVEAVSRLRAPDGAVRTPKSKEILRSIPKGTVLCQKAGGGGGYGNPFRRPAVKVAGEVRNGFISVEAARRDYGVVIDPTTLAIDEDATRSLRRGAA